MKEINSNCKVLIVGTGSIGTRHKNNFSKIVKNVIYYSYREDENITNDKAEAIVLGCAGMADFAEKLEKKFSIPVIEGVSSSIILAEGLVKMKKTTSKLGRYSYPRPKSYSGIFKPFEFKK